ncbi:nuclease-related domain-containing protein [Rossellomorea aquimaris]|uniref:NERD domain-containing protein n=1 Tax=Rossellomorea aquimaris TaxID=189382 RepID=A0A5D4TLS9_9BACI|nr:nuclease-related domain-containing protein [Rossellomorea aquimaris]TYS75758.1 NERD domain-containing protein [Rossellomorea aquimaris]
MPSLLNFFKKTKTKSKQPKIPEETKKPSERIAARKGELGEYKIDIQLDQLPNDYRYLSDLLIANPKAKSGYSQIDHVVICPYGIFTIETKNYQGTIYGGKTRKTWSVNGQFKMMNPFIQNYGHIQALSSLVDRKAQDLFISMVSFTKRCTFKVDMDYRKISSKELIVYDIELTEFINRKVSILKIQHKEPLLTKQDISDIFNAFSDANISSVETRERHKQALSSSLQNKETHQPSVCSVCNNLISPKVKSYCLANKKFKGKLYCFEHQKTI